jgi:hypothetical protein
MNSIGSKLDPARPAPNACGSDDTFIFLCKYLKKTY